MSIASEITRLQGAKADLKASINAKTDEENQITDEPLDEYAGFVDSIQTGGGGSVDNNVFIVTGSTNDYITYTIDKTYEEIVEAFEGGKLIIYTDGEISTFLYSFPGLPGTGAVFSGYVMFPDDLNILNVTEINISDSEVQVEFKSYTLTPAS